MKAHIVIALPDREYAVKLTKYWSEAEPGWTVAMATSPESFRQQLASGRKIDLALVAPDWLDEVAVGGQSAVGRVVALVMRPGDGGGRPEVQQVQPFTGLTAEVRAYLSRLDARYFGGGLGTNESGGGVASGVGSGLGRTEVIGLFSASGGVGKTTIALNLARQAVERGRRVCYLNLETLDASGAVLGGGGSDRFSRVMYALEAGEEKLATELGEALRHHPVLRIDFLEAPDHPSERLALTGDKTERLVAAFAGLGRYDVIIVDADSGAGERHRKLLTLCHRALWVVLDDWQSIAKAEQLYRYWSEAGGFPGIVSFVLNKRNGGLMNRWGLAGDGPDVSLPYVPQWKAPDQPGQWFRSPAFSGAIDDLLDRIGIVAKGRAVFGFAGEVVTPRREGGGHVVRGTVARGTG